MCFFYKPPKNKEALKKRFGVDKVEAAPQQFSNWPEALYNGFTHPLMPIISNRQPDAIQFFEWGLLPHWVSDKSFQKNTLNARLETLDEKPSFKNILTNRCLVPAEAFAEWQWQDSKGKEKIKYLLEIDKKPIFAFAGLWSEWEDQENGLVIPTFTIITTAANELMAQIHNTKQRMPVILQPESEKLWLTEGKMETWNEALIATATGDGRASQMLRLF